MNAAKKTLLILVIISIAYFLLQPEIIKIPTDANNYKQAILNDTSQVFTQPLLYFIAHDLLFFLDAELLFYWLPLLFSLIGFFALIRIFKLYNVEPEYLILFLPVFLAVLFLFDFMRDSLLWALGNSFFYFALKLKKEMTWANFLLAVSFALLSYLTKIAGLLLFIFLVFILVKKFKWKFFLPATPFIGFFILLHEKTNMLLNALVPKIENVWAFWAAIINPLFITSLIGIKKIKYSELKFVILLFYLASFFVANSNTNSDLYYDAIHVFRYTFFLSGILMLCTALLIKQGGKTLKFILIVLAIYLLDLLIYLF